MRRASLLLGVGRLDEARADLEQALARDPDAGEAYALRAVIAVALNDRADGLANGREAVKRSPTSAASRIALSYALQADFQLEAARDELLLAVKDQPGDARAWARLAELWLSLGYPDRASDAAGRAVSLAPGQARAHTVLGFAALARVDIAGAVTAFEKAIALEPGNPLARLGLGLARIRKGQLAEGRGEIEIAVALSPEDAIIRSYLGKAYFDERREPLPGSQFERARQHRSARSHAVVLRRDSQADAQPSRRGAARIFERSIALNDNRAVYRSRLLLDQDLAARSASLGRIYRDLGFEQLAPVEGWKSLDADPGDYSGHRLLADTYSALPRHEVARVSELLQSQLLQPINITPVPVGAVGSRSVSFSRAPDRLSRRSTSSIRCSTGTVWPLQGSGTVGTGSVFGDEVTVSGVWNRLSFSAGQFHYETDGLRENNQQERDLYNAFVQAQLSSATPCRPSFALKTSRLATSS